MQVRKRLSQLGIQRGVTCVYSTEPPLAPLAPLTAEQEAAVLARKAACRAAAEADEPDGEGIGELTAEKKPIQTVFVFDDEHVLAGIAFRLFSSWCSTDLQCWWPYCSLTGGAPHAAPSKHATNACYHWQCRRSCGPYPNSVDMTATLDRGDISSFLYASRLPVAAGNHAHLRLRAPECTRSRHTGRSALALHRRRRCASRGVSLPHIGRPSRRLRRELLHRCGMRAAHRMALG